MVRSFAPVSGRRPAWIALGLLGAVLLVPSYARAQAAPAQQAQAVSNKREFPNDAGLVLNFIKPDKTADFEAVMAKLKEALQKSDKPERKQQVAGSGGPERPVCVRHQPVGERGRLSSVEHHYRGVWPGCRNERPAQEICGGVRPGHEHRQSQPDSGSRQIKSGNQNFRLSPAY